MVCLIKKFKVNTPVGNSKELRDFSDFPIKVDLGDLGIRYIEKGRA